MTRIVTHKRITTPGICQGIFESIRQRTLSRHSRLFSEILYILTSPEKVLSCRIRLDANIGVHCVREVLALRWAMDEYFIRFLWYPFSLNVCCICDIHRGGHNTLALSSVLFKTGWKCGLSGFSSERLTDNLRDLVHDYELLHDRKNGLKKLHKFMHAGSLHYWHSCRKRIYSSVIKESSDFTYYSWNKCAVTISSRVSSLASLILAYVHVSVFWQYIFALFELSNLTFFRTQPMSWRCYSARPSWTHTNMCFSLKPCLCNSSRDEYIDHAMWRRRIHNLPSGK